MTDKVTYSILGEFAVGGIATLYKIVLDDGRQALLRQLQPGKILAWKHQRNFRRGTEIREKLSPHPNLVTSIERGVKGLFQPYEIIEFIEGRNLKALFNSRDPALQKNLLFILTECAEALAWVHLNGFMHLDVKPENFLVRLTSDKPVVKLTDFDLALSADSNSPHKQMGTPGYMAPEQFKKKTAYQASDVFAFSIMAYQLVTGKHPFPGNTPKESHRRQASSSVVPVPPCQINSAISTNLSNTIMMGLEKSLNKRLPDMQTVVAKLKRD